MTVKLGKLTLFCDGASRGNPGPASYGFVLLDGDKVVWEEGGVLGIQTNNVAEYTGLIRGLEKCLLLGGTQLTVKTDSQLMVRQISGQYKMKSPHLQPLLKRVKELLRELEQVEVLHIPREENKLADALANEALDNNF